MHNDGDDYLAANVLNKYSSYFVIILSSNSIIGFVVSLESCIIY